MGFAGMAAHDRSSWLIPPIPQGKSVFALITLRVGGCAEIGVAH